jgi:hypothetical protein
MIETKTFNRFAARMRWPSPVAQSDALLLCLRLFSSGYED